MNQLFVTQKSQDGREKIYRFDADRKRLVLGHSRKADIRLPKVACESIEGCIEFDDGAWVYHSFSMSDKAPIMVALSQGGKFRIGDSVFSTKVVDQKSLFDESPTDGELGEQVVLFYFRGQIFHSTHVIPGETLKIELAGEILSIKTMQTRSWVSETQGSFQIRQKTLARQNTVPFRQNLSEMFAVTKSDRYTMAGVLFAMFMGITSSFIIPKTEVKTVESEFPKSSQPMVMKLVPPTERKERQASVNKNEQPQNNRVSRIQDLSQSIAARAGKFLKKASRMPASIGPNGTLNAPAMGVANLDGPSTDWNVAAGAKVAGQVGGQLGGGTGGGRALSGNGVGTSGVNLLEQESEVTGGLDREVIAEFIRRNIGHILYCYERSLSANPNLFGKVSVRFVIGATGQVQTQKIGESTLRDNRVEGCILDKISQWKFPTPKGGVQVSVNYPFLFKTTN
jgi:outer membrane biosynthesis protein TonB